MVANDTTTSRRTVLRRASLAAGAATLGAFAGTGTAAATIDCPKTPGYWKNHTDSWSCTYLVLGGDRYEAAEVLEILETPPRGDKSIVLAHQLIATKLNICNGPAAEAEKDAFMDCVRRWRNRGDGWLVANGPIGSGVRRWNGGEEVKDMLDRYNNGQLSCPSDCP